MQHIHIQHLKEVTYSEHVAHIPGVILQAEMCWAFRSHSKNGIRSLLAPECSLNSMLIIIGRKRTWKRMLLGPSARRLSMAFYQRQVDTSSSMCVCVCVAERPREWYTTVAVVVINIISFMFHSHHRFLRIFLCFFSFLDHEIENVIRKNRHRRNVEAGGDIREWTWETTNICSWLQTDVMALYFFLVLRNFWCQRRQFVYNKYACWSCHCFEDRNYILAYTRRRKRNAIYLAIAMKRTVRGKWLVLSCRFV